jgi:hypothetical protein
MSPVMKSLYGLGQVNVVELNLAQYTEICYELESELLGSLVTSQFLEQLGDCRYSQEDFAPCF